MPVRIRKLPATGVSSEALSAVTVIPVFEAEANRACELLAYEKRTIRKVSVDQEIIAYASPDSTYAVTRKLFDAATVSILIGIYDFSAGHIRELLLAAIARGVTVSLMLDVDNKKERSFFEDLLAMGVEGVEAPSCANATVRQFSSSHEKVIIIDDEWTLVQSGNYSDHSSPLNPGDGDGSKSFRTGNRDTGLAIRSTKLARFFTEILRADMALVAATPQLLEDFAEEESFLIEKAPSKRPAQLFPSKRFKLSGPLELTPVLSPDNYMKVVPKLLRAAKKSILIEQQYIKAQQELVRELLRAIADARANNPDLDVRIVLGKLFNADKLDEEREILRILRTDFDLKLGRNIRYVNTKQLVHCHNKMIVVDGEAVLVSSQNWSDAAVSRNREAGIWTKHSGLADYFGAIFEVDWKAAFKSPETGLTTVPESLQGGGYIRVERADYEEV